ncbi:hypothetical protein AAVH_22457 [Aphelenchoides avenae]|nr:hypothetical protein AAVH_22457 [Aphelenchus avenae]
MAQATPQAIASMTDAQCKEALHVACKVACEMTQIAGLRNAQYVVMGERLNTQSNHEKLFFQEALKATQALSQLRRELEEKAKECVDLANGVKTAADRLNMLGSDRTTKSIAGRV